MSVFPEHVLVGLLAPHAVLDCHKSRCCLLDTRAHEAVWLLLLQERLHDEERQLTASGYI